MLDVIIPVLNEEHLLTKRASYYAELAGRAHLIFVDGGSNDRTVEIAAGYGDVLKTRCGKTAQKNRGAEAARSDYLLFLHADSLIEVSALERIERTLRNGIFGGCCTMVIDDGALLFRFFEQLINFRARYFKILDGDLGQFVHKDIFRRIGGYDNVPVMEDILFGKKLKRAGAIVVLPELINVSARKWRTKGFLRTSYQYIIAYFKLWSGSIKSNRIIRPIENFKIVH